MNGWIDKGFCAALILLSLVACSTSDRYKAIASACQTYTVALSTAASLNRDGKLSAANVSRIDATVKPAEAVCSGPSPSTDPEAIAKVTALVIAVLEAQK